MDPNIPSQPIQPNQMPKKKHKSIFLYDFLVPTVGDLGLVLLLILAVNYIWNFVILISTLLFIKKLEVIGWKSIFSKNILITIGGAIIDTIAIVLANGIISNFNKITPPFSLSIFSSSIRSSPLSIFLSIILLIAFNYFIGKKLFKLSNNEALILGVAMGMLTAPWISSFNEALILGVAMKILTAWISFFVVPY